MAAAGGKLIEAEEIATSHLKATATAQIRTQTPLEAGPGALSPAIPGTTLTAGECNLQALTLTPSWDDPSPVPGHAGWRLIRRYLA